MDSGNYGAPVDNYWGSNSDAALKNYQFNRLGPGQDDGCAGPVTWNAMGLDVSDSAGVGGCPNSSIWFWPGQSVINRSTCTTMALLGAPTPDTRPQVRLASSGTATLTHL